MTNKFLIRTLLCINSTRVSLISLRSHSIYLSTFKRVVLDENPTSFVYCSQCNNILKFHRSSWTTLIRHVKNHSYESAPVSSSKKIQKSVTKCITNNQDRKADDLIVMDQSCQSNRKFKLKDPRNTQLDDNSQPFEKILKTKYVRGKKLYFVKWLNLSRKFDSWVKEQDLTII